MLCNVGLQIATTTTATTMITRWHRQVCVQFFVQVAHQGVDNDCFELLGNKICLWLAPLPGGRSKMYVPWFGEDSIMEFVFPILDNACFFIFWIPREFMFRFSPSWNIHFWIVPLCAGSFFLKKNCPPTVGKLCFEFVRGYGQRFVYVTVVLNFDRFFVFSPPHAQITMSIFIATCVIVEPGTKYAKNSNS